MTRNIFNAVLTRIYGKLKSHLETGDLPTDFSSSDRELYQFVKPYTMTSPERVYALLRATEYIHGAKIPGDMVECGVWRGGSMMAVARTLLACGSSDRQLYLFDTYEGMPEPTCHDISATGVSAAETFNRHKQSADSSNWCHATLDDVRENMGATGYPTDRLNFIKGKVEDTIPAAAPECIALLRLDTDWYESTRHELRHLYARLSPGGILILDDYGHWQGARKATDEFLAENKIPLLLNRVDATGRIAQKPW